MHTVPATKRPSPSQDFHLSFSFKTKTEKRTVKRTLSLSTLTTTLTCPWAIAS